VQDAVVVARPGPDQTLRLVAYVVPRDRSAVTASALRRTLAERLPAAFVPSVYVRMDALPTLPNGKVDRHALPEPDTARPELAVPYAPPGGPMEQVLARLWAEVLGVDRVGIHDHFLDLGGNSLLASQVVARLIQQYRVKLPLAALFSTATVAEMAPAVTRHLAEAAMQEPAPHDEIERLLAALNERRTE